MHRLAVGCGVQTHFTAHWKPEADFYSRHLGVTFELLGIILDCSVIDDLVRHFPVLHFQRSNMLWVAVLTGLKM